MLIGTGRSTSCIFSRFAINRFAVGVASSTNATPAVVHATRSRRVPMRTTPAEQTPRQPKARVTSRSDA